MNDPDVSNALLKGSGVKVCGVLQKLSQSSGGLLRGAFHKPWQGRFFTVEERQSSTGPFLCLSYYLDEAASHNLRSETVHFPLSVLGSVSLLSTSGRASLYLGDHSKLDPKLKQELKLSLELVMEVETPERAYFLRASNKECLHTWVAYLQRLAGLPLDPPWKGPSTLPPIPDSVIKSRRAAGTLDPELEATLPKPAAPAAPAKEATPKKAAAAPALAPPTPAAAAAPAAPAPAPTAAPATVKKGSTPTLTSTAQPSATTTQPPAIALPPAKAVATPAAAAAAGGVAGGAPTPKKEAPLPAAPTPGPAMVTKPKVKNFMGDSEDVDGKEGEAAPTPAIAAPAASALGKVPALKVPPSTSAAATTTTHLPPKAGTSNSCTAPAAPAAPSSNPTQGVQRDLIVEEPEAEDSPLGGSAAPLPIHTRPTRSLSGAPRLTGLNKQGSIEEAMAAKAAADERKAAALAAAAVTPLPPSLNSSMASTASSSSNITATATAAAAGAAMLSKSHNASLLSNSSNSLLDDSDDEVEEDYSKLAARRGVGSTSSRPPSAALSEGLRPASVLDGVLLPVVAPPTAISMAARGEKSTTPISSSSSSSSSVPNTPTLFSASAPSGVLSGIPAAPMAQTLPPPPPSLETSAPLPPRVVSDGSLKIPRPHTAYGRSSQSATDAATAEGGGESANSSFIGIEGGASASAPVVPAAASASTLDTSSFSTASRGRYEWDDDVEEGEGEGKRGGGGGEGSSWRALPVVPLVTPTNNSNTSFAALSTSSTTTTTTVPLRTKVGEENGVVKGAGVALQGRKEYTEEEKRKLHIGSPGAVKADDNILEDWD